jgi:hypothetical protein
MVGATQRCHDRAMREIDERAGLTRAEFVEQVRPAYRPLVVRNAVSEWPLIEAGRQSAQAAADYIERLDTGAPADVMVAPPAENGRFFYRDDMRGFNFRRERTSLTRLARLLLELEDQDAPIAIYAGAVSTAAHLPGFAERHRFGLLDDESDAIQRLWIGNASQVASHFDMSDNFAVVVRGERRFTLFPPEATPDLYVGPLNITIAGQPVSMVDPLAPDLERYPRFARASESALQATLQPGDALYIPALWWHHVEANGPFNILVNYWHNDVASGGAFLALVHALMAVRDLPREQREAWRVWFEHFVFGEEAAHAADYLPPHGRGINGPASPERNEAIRQFLIRVLSEPE